MAQNEKLNIGDVVRLKSGGPLMTIERYADKTSNGAGFHCMWFLDGELKSGFFPPETLKQINKPTAD